MVTASSGYTDVVLSATSEKASEGIALERWQWDRSKNRNLQEQEYAGSLSLQYSWDHLETNKRKVRI